MNNSSDSEGKGERSHGHLGLVIWQLDEMRLFVASSAPTDAPVSVGGKPLLGPALVNSMRSPWQQLEHLTAAPLLAIQGFAAATHNVI